MILILDEIELFLDPLARLGNVPHLERATRGALQTHA